jgi:hypothetical protein
MAKGPEVNLLCMCVSKALRKKQRSDDILILVEKEYFKITKSGFSDKDYKLLEKLFPELYPWDLINK